MLEFLDPVGCWLQPLSGYSRCQLVLTLHVTLRLCFAYECHHLCRFYIHQALRCVRLSPLLPYADILGNPNSQVQDGMIGTDPQYEYAMGHWLLDDFGKPGMSRLHA